MTDHKFTDDEVIHHLDCYENLGYRWCGYAIALINRQKAEIERLNAVHADMTESLRLAAEANKDMQAVIERLESLCEKIGIANDAKFERICVLQEDLETAKSEAIKDFAQRLKEKAFPDDSINTQVVVDVEDIEDLVKEMVEKSK